MKMPKLFFYGDSNLTYFKAEDDTCRTVFRTEGTTQEEESMLRHAVVCVNAHDALIAVCEASAKSEHHPLCEIHSSRNVCSCHVGKACAALDLARK